MLACGNQRNLNKLSTDILNFVKHVLLSEKKIYRIKYYIRYMRRD